jgi:hypothetical protein
MWNDLKRAARIQASRRQLLGEALIALLIARGAMAFLPFRRIAAWLRLGSCVVTGGPGHQRFKAFTTFARRQP